MSLRYRLFVTIMVLSLCLSAALSVAAQDGLSIAVGETASGEVTDAQPEVHYSFAGEAGQVILIRLTAAGSNLDPYLQLLAPDGSILFFNDDMNGLNSLIGPVTLPESATYTVVATRCCPGSISGSTGAYELSVSETEITAFTAGETVTATLSTDSPTAFFSLTPGDANLVTLYATTQPGDAPITVNVTDAAGVYVNQAWQMGNQPATIDPLVLTPGADYLVNVSLQPEGPSPAEGNATVSILMTPIESQPITLGEAASGTLNDDNVSDHYTFTAEAGALLRLAATVSTPDQPLEAMIISPGGFTLNGMTTIPGGDENGFELDPVRVTESGEHLIVVRRINYDPAGTLAPADYTLTLSESQVPTLELGVAQEGTIGSPDVFERVFRYVGTEGETIRVTLASVTDGYAPAVVVEGPQSEAEFGMMDSRIAPNAFLFSISGAQPGTATYEVTLPVSGVYVFRVSNGAFNNMGAMEGNFSLIVEAAGA